jgi:hypothetical protein
MKRRLALLAGAAMLSTLGILAPASPVSATAEADVCAGVGDAFLSLGLSYPVTAEGPQPPNLVSFFFNLSLGACAALPEGLSATGTLHGWCGHSTGQGVTNNGASFHFVSAGGTLVVYGHVAGTVNAVPDLLSGSCLNKTASHFTIVGAAVLQPVLTGLLPCVGPSCTL